MERIVVLDTETTGLDPNKGHKIIEIACVELIDLVPTNNTYQQFINPKRDIPNEAFAIHGLSSSFLKNFPTFDRVIEDFLRFIADDTVVIHNASFDLGFLNAELKKLTYPNIKNPIIDSLEIARRKFPGSPCNLDALCKRFNISLEKRSKHGALIDTQLLSLVFIELSGGRQRKLKLLEEQNALNFHKEKRIFPKRQFPISNEEKELHKKFMANNFKKHYWNEH